MKYILIALFALSSFVVAEEAAKPETPKAEEAPAPVETVLDKKAILALAEEMAKLKADKTMTDALREEKLAAMSPVGKKFSLVMMLTNVSKERQEYTVRLEDRSSVEVIINHKKIKSVSRHPKDLISIFALGKYDDMAIRTVGKKYTVTGTIKTFDPDVYQCEEKKKNKAIEARMNVDGLVLTE